jgi:hypothetical protein
MAGETVTSAPQTWWDSYWYPHPGAGMINNNNGTITISDGVNFIATIPTPPNFHDVLPSNGWFPNNFHSYVVDSYVKSTNADALMNWVIRNPTANLNNAPSTPYGTANDATPTVGPQSGIAWMVPSVLGDNRVHTYTTVNELNGRTMNVNLTDLSHLLYNGIVAIETEQNPDGSATIHHYGVGEGFLQSEMLSLTYWVTGAFINNVWTYHYPDANHPLYDPNVFGGYSGIPEYRNGGAGGAAYSYDNSYLYNPTPTLNFNSNATSAYSNYDTSYLYNAVNSSANNYTTGYNYGSTYSSYNYDTSYLYNSSASSSYSYTTGYNYGSTYSPYSSYNYDNSYLYNSSASSSYNYTTGYNYGSLYTPSSSYNYTTGYNYGSLYTPSSSYNYTTSYNYGSLYTPELVL